MTAPSSLTKENVAVYTDPSHDLYVAPAKPDLDAVKKGERLQDGEVSVGIRSTGICGYESFSGGFPFSGS